MHGNKIKVHVIVTGTDPRSREGGIGTVMEGYFCAMRGVGLSYESIPSYYPTLPGGRSLLWMKAIMKVMKAVRICCHRRVVPVVYSHAGAGISLVREACLLLVAKVAGATTMMQIHAPEVDGYLNKKVKKLFLRVVLRPADVVCLLTEWWRERLRTANIRKSLAVIPNPLPPHLEKIAANKNIRVSRNQSNATSELTVFTMARLVNGKGVDVAIRALAHIREGVRLIIAGDGVMRQRLEAIVKEIRLEHRVQMTGWVSGQEKLGHLNSADIFCLPSTNDAFPMTFVEAMAYGLPVIGVKWGGIPDLVAHQEVGILIDAPEPHLVADAITTLLDQDVREKMGMQAKSWILEISSAKVVGNRINEVIASALTTT